MPAARTSANLEDGNGMQNSTLIAAFYGNAP
jgi:hypothetical protein